MTPWPLIVGMRRILAHHDGAVDLDKVHSVVGEHLPQPIEELAAAIATLEQDTGWAADEGE